MPTLLGGRWQQFPQLFDDIAQLVIIARRERLVTLLNQALGFGLIARALDVGQRFFELVFPHVGIAIVRRHRQFVGEPQLALKFCCNCSTRLRFTPQSE